MKKKLYSIRSIIGLIIGGYFILNEYQKKRLVSEAQEKADEYVKDNYEDVESVQVTPGNYGITPMGSLGVGGHINNDDHLTFHITFLIEYNEIKQLATILEGPNCPTEKGEEQEDE